MGTPSCLNCHFTITDNSNFCPNCGAPLLKGRLSTKEVLSELLDVIFLWNKTFFKTVGVLFAGPSRVFSFYITGGRNKYMNPLFFLLLCFLIYQLYILITNQELFFISGMKGSVDGFNEGRSSYNGSSLPEVDTSAFDKLNRYSKILFFLILPIIALCSKIVFKSKKLNYAEHLSVCSYMLGQAIMITLIISGILLLLNINIKITGIITSFLCAIYVGICQYQIFRNKVVISIFKSVIFLILSFILTGIPYNILSIIIISVTK
jgi:hypothetical protein